MNLSKLADSSRSKQYSTSSPSILPSTPRDGTHPLSISNLARRYGLRSDIRTGLNLQDLRAALKEGTTVIIDLQAWSGRPVNDWKNNWEDGHYAVLVGMDDAYVYFMDPSAHGAYAYLSHARTAFPGALIKVQ